MPMRCSVLRIDGHVPSPTPNIGTFADSTNVTLRCGCSAANKPALSQPAVPPPKTTIFVIGLVMS